MKLSNIFSRKNRILLRELVITDFKLRYQGSVLGYVWSLLKPLLLFAIMYMVFVHFLRFGEGIPHFAVALLLGIILWTFFSEATNQGMQAIVSRGDLIRKINFPKYIIVISGTISALINLIFNLIVVFVFMLFDGVDFGWGALLFPLGVLVLYAFSLGLAFFLSASFVKYRDIGHIWEILMQALFYATPIIYPLQMVLEKMPEVVPYMMINPLATLIQDARANLVGNENVITNAQVAPNLLFEVLPYIIVALVCFIGFWYFKKAQQKFAEII